MSSPGVTVVDPVSCIAHMSSCRHPHSSNWNRSWFWVSVTLYRSMIEQFSHVRLVIVYEDNPELVDLHLCNSIASINPQGWVAARRSKSTTTHREVQSESICTVILKMTYGSRDQDSRESNMHILQLDRSIPLLNNLKIGYDHTFPLSSSSASIYLPLYNSHRWVEGSTWGGGYESDLENWYIVSVYPHPSYGTARGSLASNLPPRILKEIVLGIIWDYNDPHAKNPRHWPSGLLAYAMVCKAWYHVRDLYWLIIGDRAFSAIITLADYGTPLLYAAEQLETRPELCKYMQRFEEKQWIIPDALDHLQTCALYRRILIAVGANILDLTISFSALRQVSEEGLLALPQLEAVEIKQPVNERWYASYLPLRDDDKIERQQSILEIQHLLEEYHNLKYLVLQDAQDGRGKWKRPRRIRDISDDSPPCHSDTVSSDNAHVLQGPNGRPPTYTLEHLKATHMVVTYSHLHYLIYGSSTHPQLIYLNLTSVNGLSNADLSQILRSVSGTLESLEIEDCDIPSPEEGQELAFDANAAFMKELHSTRLTPGHLASPLAIARKPRLELARYPWLLYLFKTDPKEFLKGMLLSEALQLSAPADIGLNFNCMRNMTEEIEKVLDLAAGVARERKIQFQYGTRFCVH